MKFKKNKYDAQSVSVSELSEMMVCENIIILKQKHGRKNISTKAIREGNQEHERFHKAVVSHQTDQRCFIASAVFGPHDAHTEQLRIFRDVYLLPYIWGRYFVHQYYCFSPMIAKMILICPGMTWPVSILLKVLIYFGLGVGRLLSWLKCQ